MKRRKRLPLLQILISLAIALLLFLTLTGKNRRLATSGTVIELLTADGMSGGTGFEVIAPSGKQYTLTNRHMCEANAVFAQTTDHPIPLRILQMDTVADLCLLEGVENMPAATVSAEPAEPGDHVEVYGFGNLLPLTRTDGEYVGTMYDVFVKLQFGFFPDYVTAVILPGNSGSPVFNAEGKVVGVVFASGITIAFRALIVPLSYVQAFLEPY